MKPWFATVAAGAFLCVPALASADETRIAPEAHWSATPGTPELVAVSQPRIASPAPEQAVDTGAAQRSRPPFALTEHDARDQAVNKMAMEESVAQQMR